MQGGRRMRPGSQQGCHSLTFAQKFCSSISRPLACMARKSSWFLRRELWFAVLGSCGCRWRLGLHCALREAGGSGCAQLAPSEQAGHSRRAGNCATVSASPRTYCCCCCCCSCPPCSIFHSSKLMLGHQTRQNRLSVSHTDWQKWQLHRHQYQHNT